MKLGTARILQAKLYLAIKNAELDNRDTVDFDIDAELSSASDADDAARADLQAAIDEAE